MNTDERSLGPVELEVAAGEMGDDRAAGAAGEHAGDADGTGAGAARQRDPRAALPGAHRHLARALDLHDVHVHPARECPMMLEQRAQRF